MEGEKYSIFIVGMFGIPSHIERFIRNLKQTNPSISITLYSDREKEGYSQEIYNYIDEYIQRKVWTGWPSRLWKFRTLFNLACYRWQFKKLAKTRHYDIVNIHYPSYLMAYVMDCVKMLCDTIVISPWGSDVLRVCDIKRKKKLRKIFEKADYVTTSSNSNIGSVLINDLKIDGNKFFALSWGSETIDYINEHNSDISSDKAKEQLNLQGRYLITCGYNAFEEQRHETMIQAINRKRKELPDNLTLLFPVTYGCSYGTSKQEYVVRLKKLCQELNLPAVFYENYLSVPELFLLRRATDMFIHIQTTDAGNSSLREYVLCGSKVVHGAWIHYNYLEQYKPLFYYPVKELDGLGDVIVNAFNAEPIETPIEVIENIQNRGWKKAMQRWNEFFISCINN